MKEIDRTKMERLIKELEWFNNFADYLETNNINMYNESWIMQTIKKEMKYFKKYNRCLLHKRYLEKRVTDLRNEICRDGHTLWKSRSIKKRVATQVQS